MTISSKFAEEVLQCCGLGAVQYYGKDPLGALDCLLRKGLNTVAYTNDSEQVEEVSRYFSKRCFYAESPLAIPGVEKNDIIIIENVLEQLPLAELKTTLVALRRHARTVVLLLSLTNVEEVFRNRDWWEAVCIESGMRRHPRNQQIVSYGELNDSPENLVIFMDSIPDDLLAAYPLEVLKAERDLHMDMLREAGRRSDAHLVRYHLSASFVRPGDTILDCACGLGYGSYMLFHNSPAKSVLGIDLSDTSVRYATDNYGCGDFIRFQQGDAQNLANLPDNSVDFITGFETIEHLPDPEAYLKEFARVLRPSGRILISVPNEWPIDPLKAYPPYHCQEYTWERFRQEMSQYFILDTGFSQTAGGGDRCMDALRTLREIPVDKPLSEDCEWILLLGMADPRKGKGLSFVETTHCSQPEHSDYHATAYEKSYINPWLAKGLTTWPMQNAEQRRCLSQKVMEEYPNTSADYGAALCVLAYRHLEKMEDAAFILDTLAKIQDYLETSDTLPHCIRWRISLLYVGAFLYRKIGEFEQAEKWFVACGDMDPLEFSAMSGTKTTDALYQAALYALAHGNVDVALKRLHKSIEIGQKLVQGSWFNICGNSDMPVTFGMHDLTQLMENLTRSTYTLHQVETWCYRPAFALSQSCGLFEVRMNGLEKYISNLNREIANQQQQIANHQKQTQKIIEGYENSKSWKLTAPLRKLVSFFRVF